MLRKMVASQRLAMEASLRSHRAFRYSTTVITSRCISLDMNCEVFSLLASCYQRSKRTHPGFLTQYEALLSHTTYRKLYTLGSGKLKYPYVFLRSLPSTALQRTLRLAEPPYLCYANPGPSGLLLAGSLGTFKQVLVCNIFTNKSMPLTYDHRLQSTEDPVRSPDLKLQIGRSVVVWVTSSESLLLYVFFWSFLASSLNLWL